MNENGNDNQEVINKEIWSYEIEKTPINDKTFKLYGRFIIGTLANNLQRSTEEFELSGLVPPYEDVTNGIKSMIYYFLDKQGNDYGVSVVLDENDIPQRYEILNLL